MLSKPTKRWRSESRRDGGSFVAEGLAVFSALAVFASTVVYAQVAETKHNLTSTGSGSVRTTTAAGVCVFCHAPHNANPTKGLWNRALPAVTYTPYTSTSQIARPGQPTGSSRLCLSCHDGTMAMGTLRVPPGASQSSLGVLTGPTVLGTDLSASHPISIAYNQALVAARGDLANPTNLPKTIPLDSNGDLQCSTCHDPHTNERPDFLRADRRNSALCMTCHQPAHWGGSAHATAPSGWNGSGSKPWPPDSYATVAENACENCHRPHGAGHGPRLLAQSTERLNCTVCHNGSVATKNVEAEFSKAYHHPVEIGDWVHDPNEDPNLMAAHVTCTDCHNPHATIARVASQPATSGALRGVGGVTRSGGTVKEATNEYEVCFKCHGLKESTMSRNIREDGTRIVRLKIDAANRSFHPVESVGRNATMTGFTPGYGASSVIGCVDCHNNDAWSAAGPAPRGAHGSRYPAILERQYVTSDPTPESPSSYALCYKCHDRGYLLGDTARTFSHRKHVVDQSASCDVCHDPHGSRQRPFLLDFTLRDAIGRPIVAPASSGRLEYTQSVPGHGTCYLTCHGSNHNPRSY